MTLENLELVRSIFAAYEHGDYHSNEWAHPTIEYVIADGPSPGRWLGLAGMPDAWREWLNAWEGLRVDVEEYRELDAKRVLVVVTGLAGRLPRGWQARPNVATPRRYGIAPWLRLYSSSARLL